jgi:hypothetical protein
MKYLGRVSSGLVLIIFMTLACDDPETDEVELEFEPDDVQVVMPPAGEFYIESNTAIISTNDEAPLVHSWPKYAGVPQAGGAGLGSGIGYNAGQRVTIPFNINLGDRYLSSYEVRINVEQPEVLDIVTIEGSNYALNIYYPEQYERAQGFEIYPQASDGQTAGVVTISTQPVQEPASGRINLFNLLIDLETDTPQGGTWIIIEAAIFTDPAGLDACPAAGCVLYDCIFIKEFEFN